MVFHKPRVLDSIQITVNDVIIKPAISCTYLGVIIDHRLNWRQHIQSKCIAAKKAFHSIAHCFRKTWGLSRSKLQLFYKAVFIPILLYNCSVWAKAATNQKNAKLLASTQRPFLLAISKA
jgi:hypothetical protein